MRIDLVNAAGVGTFDFGSLKQNYIDCFGVHIANVTTWREAVAALMDRGCSREILVEWGVDAGYGRKYVSDVLSRILCSTGQRKRKVGAGRKPSAEVMALLAYARGRYGDNCLKVLRAAWRTGKGQLPPKGVHQVEEVGLALLGVHNNENGLLWTHNKESERLLPFTFRSNL